MSWVTVIAIATLLQAIGYFLDEYHISTKSKDWARLLLMRAFVALDSVSIPDLPRHILIFLLRPKERLRSSFIRRLLFLYMTVALMIFLALSALNEVGLALILTLGLYFGSDLPFGVHLLAVLYITFFFGLPVVTYNLMRYIFGRLWDHRWTIVRYASPLLAVLGASLAMAIIIVVSWLDDYLSIALLISVSMPVVFVCLVTTVGVLLKLLLDAIRWVAMTVFDAASSPTVSPFRYAATLMGVLLVGAKAIQQFTMS